MEIKAISPEGREVRFEEPAAAKNILRDILEGKGFEDIEFNFTAAEAAAEAAAVKATEARRRIMESLKVGDRIIESPEGLQPIRGRVTKVASDYFEVKVRQGWHMTLKASENWILA